MNRTGAAPSTAHARAARGKYDAHGTVVRTGQCADLADRVALSSQFQYLVHVCTS